ncbi:MAG: type II secretion system major pseudopilin GspG [Oceanicoccus sp.]|uniref:type II secretion system major pseudopilin GspG n=1 Tax=Oceanicoccus sp. TaxID=2691044 RepID=UPI0026347D94|nr:type II secretion system major pseudopilin GspG [Oceanicoccus sp.]MCP3908836.1 type II secretion system major pseudopilin GspG [Oceanicoccus sp.]MDG1773297.1 type II secretion system major pseudopilin GspG [Oceanicoccus sp.]
MTNSVSKTFNRRQQGFTLIEIMVVVVIISVLIGLVAPNILGRVDEAKVTAAQTDIATIEQALEMYKLDNQIFPSTDQGLQALVEKPNTSPVPRKWNSAGYLKKGKLPVDPWGTEYQYISPGSTGAFDIYSLGADGREGGEGYDADIGN